MEHKGTKELRTERLLLRRFTPPSCTHWPKKETN